MGFRSSRTTSSKRSISIWASFLEIPVLRTNSTMASGLTPLRLRPLRVGSLGSSQPETYPPSTSLMSFLLESTVWLKSSRANSYWWGLGEVGSPHFPLRFSMTQS